jgi:hypothetical protein
VSCSHVCHDDSSSVPGECCDARPRVAVKREP